MEMNDKGSKYDRKSQLECIVLYGSVRSPCSACSGICIKLLDQRVALAVVHGLKS